MNRRVQIRRWVIWRRVRKLAWTGHSRPGKYNIRSNAVGSPFPYDSHWHLMFEEDSAELSSHAKSIIRSLQP